MFEQKVVHFLRVSLQGISIASIGTLGVTPSWGGFVLGIAAFVVAITLLMHEQEN